MEKSIETIWKEGFLRNDQMIAPKINDLYNQKSLGIIEKIKRMLKVNLIAIVVISLVVLVWWYFLDVLHIGIFVCLALNGFAFYVKVQTDHMKEADQGTNSYDYLRAFDHWLETSMKNNTRVMRFFYPMMFLAAVATIWFSNDNAAFLKEFFTTHYPQLALWGDIPVAVLVVVMAVTLAITFFAGRIYRWDVNLVYGRAFKKLKEILSDMEELRS
jgi:hypothetical protein